MAYTAPQTPADALPPLVITICEVCSGTGGDEDYDGSAILCEYCDGRGCTEACSECGEKPTVKHGFDSCLCNAPSYETCEDEPNPAEIDGICRSCYLTGLEAIREDAPDEILRAELQWAKEVAGWI